MPRHLSLAALLASAALGGCMVGPNYHRPGVATPTAFKEAAGWTQPSRPTPRRAATGGRCSTIRC
ncbi:MAG: hypothetical protein WDM92_13915 [Caulobacteraceae bacterium]